MTPGPITSKVLRMSTTLVALAALALAMMTSAQPSAPWRDTYPTTAAACATSAHERPLFAGVDGEQKSVALLVSVAWFESTFNPRAEGDGNCLVRDAPTGRCVKRGPAHSFCLGQIGDSNFAALNVTREELLDDVNACVGAMNTMLRQSLQICRERPEEDRLGWYAAGGDGCSRGLIVSGHRVRKAKWLFSNVRTPAHQFFASEP